MPTKGVDKSGSPTGKPKVIAKSGTTVAATSTPAATPAKKIHTPVPEKKWPEGTKAKAAKWSVDARPGGAKWAAGTPTNKAVVSVAPDPRSVSNAEAVATVTDPGLKLSPDARTALHQLSDNPRAFAAMDARLKSDPAFVTAALRTNPDVFFLLDATQKSNAANVMLAVGLKPSLYEALDPSQQADQKIAMQALRSEPAELKKFPAALREDRTFLRTAVNEEPETVQYLDADVRDDREFMVPVLKQNPGAFQFVGPSMAHDLGLAREAVVRDPDLIQLHAIPKEILGERDTMLACAKADGSSLEFMPWAMHSDREIVMAAVSTFRDALRVASDPLRADPDIIRAAVRKDVSQIRAASGPLMKDEAFIGKLCRDDPRIALQLQGDYAPSSCLQHLLDTDAELAAKVDGLKARLKAAGIDNPERFSDYATLEEILKNRENPNTAADPRAVAVYVFPKEDNNGAFTYDNLTELTKSYRVMYYEATQDTQMAASIRSATAARKASVLVLGGHGAQTIMSLGSEVPGWRFGQTISPATAHNEPYFLDLNDGDKLRAARVSDGVLDGAEVILKSCLTGRTRSSQANLANFVATIFPQANVYAMTNEGNNLLTFDSSGKVTGPGFSGGEAVTYHVRPADPET